MGTRAEEPAMDAPDYDFRIFLADDGCDLASSCLTCPLSACRFGRPPGVARTELLVQQLRQLAADGKSAAQIGAAVGRSVRSVYRIARAHGVRISGGQEVDA